MFVSKTSWRRLLDMSSRRLQDMSSRRLQGILKTSWKTKNCYAEDVLKTFSRHVLKTSRSLLERLYLFSPFRKNMISFCTISWVIFGKSEGQNQNLTYPISPTRVLVNFLWKSFESSTFQDFQVWMLFLVPQLDFWKK